MSYASSARRKPACTAHESLSTRPLFRKEPTSNGRQYARSMPNHDNPTQSRCEDFARSAVALLRFRHCSSYGRENTTCCESVVRCLPCRCEGWITTKGTLLRETPGFRFRTAAAATALIAVVCFIASPVTVAMGSSTLNGWSIATEPSPTGSWNAVDYGGGHWVALVTRQMSPSRPTAQRGRNIPCRPDRGNRLRMEKASSWHSHQQRGSE